VATILYVGTHHGVYSAPLVAHPSKPNVMFSCRENIDVKLPGAITDVKCVTG
jgi:hypothetical protein